MSIVGDELIIINPDGSPLHDNQKETNVCPSQ